MSTSVIASAPRPLPLPGTVLRVRSDEQLLAMFREGRDEAFDAIHDRYRARLLGYVRHMLRGSHDAEDVLQDVFVRAYGSLRHDRREVALRPWLYRVAHNRCIDLMRRPAATPSEMERDEGLAPDIASEVQQREELRDLVRDVQRLPAQQRSALIIRELEGLSYEDLAATLGVSVPAVKSLLVRARLGLAEAAEGRHTACAEIQAELGAGRRGRPSARVRHHVRDCPECRALQGVRRTRAHALLSPFLAPAGLLARLTGGAPGGGAASLAGSGAAEPFAASAKLATIAAMSALAVTGSPDVRDRAPVLPPATPVVVPAPAPAVPPIDPGFRHRVAPQPGVSGSGSLRSTPRPAAPGARSTLPRSAPPAVGAPAPGVPAPSAPAPPPLPGASPVPPVAGPAPVTGAPPLPGPAAPGNAPASSPGGPVSTAAPAPQPGTGSGTTSGSPAGSGTTSSAPTAAVPAGGSAATGPAG